jgi:hypothetical protein
MYGEKEGKAIYEKFTQAMVAIHEIDYEGHSATTATLVMYEFDEQI